MAEQVAGQVSLLEVKKYFEEPSSSKFSAEWRQLSDEEKTWFKMAVYEVTH